MKRSEFEKRKKELENIISNATATLNRLSKEKIEDDDPLWKPKCGETFFYIDTYGDIGSTYNTLQSDERIVELNNCFRTKEEAEFYLSMLSTILKATKLAEELDSNNQLEIAFLTTAPRYKKDFKLLNEVAKLVGEKDFNKYVLRRKD